MLVETFNQYNGEKITVVLAKDLLSKFFNSDNENLGFENYNIGDKNLPYSIVDELAGKSLSILIMSSY